MKKYKSLDNHSIHNPVFNAVGGTLIGILVLILIVFMVWWLKKKETEKKRKVVNIFCSLNII